MAIELITAATWPEILQLQGEVYRDVEPEDVEILQDKWIRSPKSCFIYREDDHLKGYLLSHPWHDDRPPKLFQRLPLGTDGKVLFLHDLAISPSSSGQGIGSIMLRHLIALAGHSGYQEIRLVSVQNSSRFWQKQGFTALPQAVCNSYGQDALFMARTLSE